MTLPQNVEDALKLMDGCISTLPEGNKRDWQIILAHLLSQDAEIADLIGKRDFLLRHYNLAESRLAAANALLRDIKDWDVNQAQGTYLMVPLNLRKRIQAHLSENIHG